MSVKDYFKTAFSHNLLPMGECMFDSVYERRLVSPVLEKLVQESTIVKIANRLKPSSRLCQVQHILEIFPRPSRERVSRSDGRGKSRSQKTKGSVLFTFKGRVSFNFDLKAVA
jgi:hypothetical protein